MGTVIKFPRVPGSGRVRRREASAKRAGASAEIIILPVVRIERMREAPTGRKAKAAKSVTARSGAVKSAAKPVITKPAIAKPAAKPASGGKRTKRVAPAVPAPACGRG
jgi:hypothetical protein